MPEEYENEEHGDYEPEAPDTDHAGEEPYGGDDAGYEPEPAEEAPEEEYDESDDGYEDEEPSSEDDESYDE